ncbi:MAG: hypothetical protein WCQ95_06655 [Bacteroidota bacterium]
MKTIKKILFLLSAALLFGCGSKLPESYHMDKKYWDTKDYEEAINYIKYTAPKEEGYPRLSDPKTAQVFMKLTDKQNVSIVLEDNQLGLKHKSEVAKEFFSIAKDILDIYKDVDNKDKFLYPMELVKSIEFFLHTQLLYFKVGNDAIIKESMNPNDAETIQVIKMNEQTVVDNFNIHIEFLTNEDAFDDASINEYATVIDVYYDKLLKEFPKADYTSIRNTSTAMLAKVKSAKLKKSLENLIEKINTKQ